MRWLQQLKNRVQLAHDSDAMIPTPDIVPRVGLSSPEPFGESDSMQQESSMSIPSPFSGNRKYEALEEGMWAGVGHAWLARDTVGGHAVYVKLVERGPSFTPQLRSELLLHARCAGHPHIVQLLDVFLTASHVALVLEAPPGDDLLTYSAARGPLPEAAARALFQQLVAGVAVLHALGASNRDARLDARLLFPPAPGSSTQVVKTQDFAYTKSEQVNSDPNSVLGSLPYTAPEVLGNVLTRGEPVDVWGLGVGLYKLALGHFPFEHGGDDGTHAEGPGHRDVVQKILGRIASAEYEIPAGTSPELADLLRRMLTRLPEHRATLGDVMEHPWVRQDCPPDMFDVTQWRFGPAGGPGTPLDELRLVALLDEGAARERRVYEDADAMADQVLAEDEMDDLLEELELDHEGELVSEQMPETR